MNNIIKSSILTLVFLSLPLFAFADSNITGYWTGTTTVSNGGGVYQNTFTFIQSGNTVIGSTPPGQNGVCNYTGSVSGNQITLHAVCPDINYSSDSSATLSATFDSMQGTFIDSQGTTGTYQASKQKNVLAPTTTINEPPLVIVSGKTVTISLLKFDSILPKQKAVRAVLASAKKALKVSYEVTIKGAEKRKLTTKKNELTIKNLKSGNYSVTYRIVAIQDGKIAQASKNSPTASFSIL